MFRDFGFLIGEVRLRAISLVGSLFGRFARTSRTVVVINLEAQSTKPDCSRQASLAFRPALSTCCGCPTPSISMSSTRWSRLEGCCGVLTLDALQAARSQLSLAVSPWL